MAGWSDLLFSIQLFFPSNNKAQIWALYTRSLSYALHPLTLLRRFHSSWVAWGPIYCARRGRFCFPMQKQNANHNNRPSWRCFRYYWQTFSGRFRKMLFHIATFHFSSSRPMRAGILNFMKFNFETKKKPELECLPRRVTFPEQHRTSDTWHKSHFAL